MKHVAIAIIERETPDGEKAFLLVSSKKDFGQYTGYYYPPGGHTETGESEMNTLVRELREELELTIMPVKKITETAGDVPNQLTSWWQCQIISGSIKPRNSEIQDANWFTQEQMKSINIWPATKTFFHEFIFHP